MWKYVTSPDGLQATIVDEESSTIVDLSVPAHSTAAQAFPETLRMIVSAPRMLEALRAIEQGAAYRLTKGPDEGDANTLRLARDAIGRSDSCLELLHVSDDGHGWIGVDYETLDRLGLTPDITSYSYKGPGRAWLEEDWDAANLIRALQIEGIDYRITEERINGDAWIRSLPPFRK